MRVLIYKWGFVKMFFDLSKNNRRSLILDRRSFVDRLSSSFLASSLASFLASNGATNVHIKKSTNDNEWHFMFHQALSSHDVTPTCALCSPREKQSRAFSITVIFTLVPERHEWDFLANRRFRWEPLKTRITW